MVGGNTNECLSRWAAKSGDLILRLRSEGRDKRKFAETFKRNMLRIPAEFPYRMNRMMPDWDITGVKAESVIVAHVV